MDDCRTGFEKWYGAEDKDCPSIIRSGDGYRLMQAQQAWIAWQAAWNTRADKAVPEWQPIETAPKDWKRVLVTDGFDVYDAYFRSGDWWQYECGDDWDSVAIKPTHWMPLPQPPTKGD